MPSPRTSASRTSSRTSASRTSTSRTSTTRNNRPQAKPARPKPAGGRQRDRKAASPPPSGPSSGAIGIAVVVAIVVVVAGIVFLLNRGGDDGPAGASSSGIAHVHALGVDPEDGMLYAGTHYGLFRVPEQGAATLVADRVQDFMGFTVVGPSRFLASGHPGEGQDGPSSLGLIESTDGGQTWASLSLSGEADFHALEARHGQVYGLNSMTGELMVSEDMKAWDVRSETAMADFAVSPDDPDVLLATTEQGLTRSEDGGRTFELVSGSPVLLLVSWAQDGTIIGAEPDGTVHASTDGGRTWEQSGNLGGAPQALTATGAGEVFAAIDAAILVSDDDGVTFTVRYSE